MSAGGSVLRRRRGRGRKAVAMVEFALLLPMFLFFLLFIIDVGSMTMQQAALQDATQQAAREGAQNGGAVQGAAGSGPGADAFWAAVAVIPGMEPARVESFKVLQGTCGKYIEVEAVYKVELVTPGLNSLMRLATGQAGSIGDGWKLRATSVARCEVVTG